MSLHSQNAIMQKNDSLPKAVLKRMIELEDVLNRTSEQKITSAKICTLTGWSESTIRHDLWLLRNINRGKTPDSDFEKGVSNGYDTARLLKAVQTALGADEAETTVGVCIVGLGRLGAALLDEALVEGSGFVIKAGFDSNVNRVEILRSTFPLYPAGEMSSVIRRDKISLAVLTVAEKDAQQMAERLSSAGITGIVNMTRAVLKVPPQVKVENISVLNALKMIC